MIRWLPGLMLVACAQDPGAVHFSFVWSEQPHFDGDVYLAARVELDGLILRQTEPKRFTMDERIALDALPNGKGMVLIGEIRDGPWLNSGVLYYGISDPFAVKPGERTAVTVVLKPGPPPYQMPQGPDPPSTEKMVLVRDRSLSTSRLEGELPAGTKLMLFSGADLGSARILGEVTADAQGAFSIELNDPPDAIFVSVLRDGLLSDVSSDPRLQGSLVERIRLTAAPPELFTVAIHTDVRDPPAYARQEREGGFPISASSDPQWHPRPNPDSAPVPRVQGAMAYDSARGHAVLFGGAASNLLGDVWIYDGDRWIDRTPAESGPKARVGHALVYDAVRDRIVLFGGEADEVLGDLWSWDGERWSQHSFEEGPAPRSGPALAYDGERGRIVLFGGRSSDGVLLADTWEWDGSTWQSIDAHGPEVRTAASLAFDGRSRRTVLFGGEGAGGELDDLWEWDGTTWSELPAADRPFPCSDAALAYDRVRGKLLLFGGISSGRSLLDLWEWDGSWRRVSTRGPLGGDLIYSAAARRALSFGRSGTWLWDGVDWIDRDPTLSPPPEQRDRFAMIFDPVRDRVVVVGGQTAYSRWTSSVWEWDDRGWSRGVDLPQAWRLPLAAYDESTNEIVLFASEAGRTLVLNSGNWFELTEGDAPSPLASKMVYDPARFATVLFDAGDTWEWDSFRWTLKASSLDGTRKRIDVGLAYDAGRGRVQLVGGREGTFVSVGSWRWDGRSWQGPFETGFGWFAHVLAYDVEGRRMMLFGGVGGFEDEDGNIDAQWSNDLLVERGTSWQRLPAAGPKPRARAAHGMVHDPERERMIMFGGVTEEHNFLSDIWTLDMPSGRKPAVGAVFDLSTEVDARVESVRISAVAGGVGAEGNGVEMLGWHNVEGALTWLTSASASPDAPEMLSAEVGSALVDANGKVHLRFAPTSGTMYPLDAKVTIETIALSADLRITP